MLEIRLHPKVHVQRMGVKFTSPCLLSCKSLIKKKSSCQLELWAVLRLQGDPQKVTGTSWTLP